MQGENYRDEKYAGENCCESVTFKGEYSFYESFSSEHL